MKNEDGVDGALPEWRVETCNFLLLSIWYAEIGELNYPQLFNLFVFEKVSRSTWMVGCVCVCVCAISFICVLDTYSYVGSLSSSELCEGMCIRCVFVCITRVGFQLQLQYSKQNEMSRGQISRKFRHKYIHAFWSLTRLHIPFKFDISNLFLFFLFMNRFICLPILPSVVLCINFLVPYN